MNNKLLKKVSLRLQGYDSLKDVVIHEYKTIYFVIPKVASSSVKTLFKDLLDIDSPSPHTAKFPHIPRHKLAEYPDYFKFCFVRNPWDRLVSCYFSKVKKNYNLNIDLTNKLAQSLQPSLSGKVNWLKYPVINSQMSFSEFVEAVAEIPDEKADKHFRSQYTFITDSEGKLITDFIGRFENLREDFETIVQKIGLPNPNLPHELKGNHKHYTSYYTPETWEIVRKRYQKDLELFNYDQELATVERSP
jgi:chondroitin 4-sulfotransferase 11